MADRILAPIMLLLFLVFIAFIAVYVNEPDLWIVIVAVGAMAMYDFWDTIRKGPDELDRTD